MALFDDFDTEQDEQNPYSSISSSPPLQPLKPTAGGSEPFNPAVRDAIMKRFQEDQGKADSFREASRGADSIASMGLAFAQAAQGSNAPKVNEAFYQGLQKQNEGMRKFMSDDMDRSAKVRAAIESRLAQEAKYKGALAQKDMGLQETSRHNRVMEDIMARRAAAAGEKAGQEKEPKGDQFKVAQFGQRMQQAEGVFKELYANKDKDGKAKQPFDPTSASAWLQRAQVPIVGIGLPNALKSGNVQQQEQAERNFINAVLRRESGAAISSGEFENAEKQYFPRAGDSPAVLKQKAQNRALAINGFKQEAGRAWDRVGSGSVQPTEMPGNDPEGNANEALAGGAQGFNERDLEMFQKALARIKADPNDETAKKALNILAKKGLK